MDKTGIGRLDQSRYSTTGVGASDVVMGEFTEDIMNSSVRTTFLLRHSAHGHRVNKKLYFNVSSLLCGVEQQISNPLPLVAIITCIFSIRVVL